MPKPRVGCYAVYEPTEEGWQDLSVQFNQMNAALVQAGLEVVAAPEPVCDDASCERVATWFQHQSIHLLHALIITWSFDHYTLRTQQMNHLPVAVRSIPGIRSGSLVGGQQLHCILYDLGVEHRLFFGEPGSALANAATAAYARACAAAAALRNTRIGMVGRRTDGMTPTAVDEVEILRLFGARLWIAGLDELLERASQITASEAQATWRQISSSARAVTCSPENAMISMRNYLALRQIVQEKELGALAIGSYPYCLGHLCLPIALLNDDGIPTGCEGDVNSTLAMFILNNMTGGPVHFGEMLDVDPTNNTIISSHCGAAAPSLADPVEGFVLCPVRLANDGVCIRFPARSGPVTYINLVGRKGNYRMCAFEGEANPIGMVFEGNPLNIRLKTPFPKIWQALEKHGFGHHWMTVYDHLVPALEEFCRISKIEGVFPDIV